MASLGYVRTVLGGLADGPKQILGTVFEHVLGNLRFGSVVHQTRAENFQVYHVSSTTATSTSEFSVLHGMGITPRCIVPTLDPSQPGAALVTLTISRAADTQRLYLKVAAGSTGVPFSLLVE